MKISKVSKSIIILFVIIVLFKVTTGMANPSVTSNSYNWTVDIRNLRGTHFSTYESDKFGIDYSNTSNQLYIEETSYKTPNNRLVGFYLPIQMNGFSNLSIWFTGKATGDMGAHYARLDAWLFKPDWTNGTTGSASEWSPIAGETNLNNVWVHLNHQWDNLDPIGNYILMIGYYDHWIYYEHQQVWIKDFAIAGASSLSGGIHPINSDFNDNTLLFGLLLLLGVVIGVLGSYHYFRNSSENSIQNNQVRSSVAHQSKGRAKNISFGNENKKYNPSYTRSCLNCGNECLQNDVFCHNCGSRI